MAPYCTSCGQHLAKTERRPKNGPRLSEALKLVGAGFGGIASLILLLAIMAAIFGDPPSEDQTAIAAPPPNRTIVPQPTREPTATPRPTPTIRPSSMPTPAARNPLGAVQNPTPGPAPSTWPTAKPKVTPKPWPTRQTQAPSGTESLSKILTVVVREIEGSARVRDAAARLEGKTFSLVLIVDYATSEQYARVLGEDFVRLLKGLGPDDPPGREIGRGKYDYVVGVYYPNERELARGAKAKTADRISW